MLIEKVQLFEKKRDFFIFLTLCLFILSYALLIEYNNYKNLIKFDSALVDAVVLKQYTKTKLTKKGKEKTYQVLKLASPKGFEFYTSAKKTYPHSLGKTLHLEIWTQNLSFFAYLTSFYAHSKILSQDAKISLKEKLNHTLEKMHNNTQVASIYKALYTATPLPKELQSIFSSLGVSDKFLSLMYN